jgi:hypothetical protein
MAAGATTFVGRLQDGRAGRGLVLARRGALIDAATLVHSVGIERGVLAELAEQAAHGITAFV